MPDSSKGMTLAARSVDLASALASLEATDGSGKALDTETCVLQCLEVLRELRDRSGSLYLAGNGGSAAVASHGATDFVNAGRIRAMTLHESSLITCMSNDFGYEQAFSRILSTYLRPAEVLIAISSSGKSPNIRNAAVRTRELGGRVMTLTGFAADNPLRGLGDFNFWVNSRDYGLVELAHQFLLLNVADRIRMAHGQRDVER